MALMRGNPYVYRNFEDRYVIYVPPGESVALPKDTMEELAVMVVAALDPEELAAAVQRAVEKHGGNFGASQVMEGLGLQSAYQTVAAYFEGSNHE